MQQCISEARGANGSEAISKLPDSILDMSRMPLTTDSRCWPESLIELGIFPALGRAQHQGLLLRDHLGEADDRVEAACAARGLWSKETPPWPPLPS